MARTDARFGGVLPARAVFYWAFGLFAFWILLLPLQPAQAGMIGFLAGSMVWLRLTLRDTLRRLSIRRTHRPRVFESDRLQVTLRVGLEEGLPIQLLEVEDLMGVSLAASQRDLIPLLTGGWEVLIHYETVADRHRGLYLMGPVRVLAADGLGVFFHEDELEPVTRLTVYPHADPLPGYAVPGPFPPPGRVDGFRRARGARGGGAWRPGVSEGRSAAANSLAHLGPPPPASCGSAQPADPGRDGRLRRSDPPVAVWPGGRVDDRNRHQRRSLDLDARLRSPSPAFRSR